MIFIRRMGYFVPPRHIDYPNISNKEEQKLFFRLYENEI